MIYIVNKTTEDVFLKNIIFYMSNDKHKYFVKEGGIDIPVSNLIASVPTYYPNKTTSNPHTYFSNFPNEGEQPLLIMELEKIDAPAEKVDTPLFNDLSYVTAFWGNDTLDTDKINKAFKYELEQGNSEYTVSALKYIDPKSAPWLPSTGVLDTSTSPYEYENIPEGMSSYVKPLTIQNDNVHFDYYQLNFEDNYLHISYMKKDTDTDKWFVVSPSTDILITNPTHCLLTIQAPGGSYNDGNGKPGGGGSCCQLVVDFIKNSKWCIVPGQEPPVKTESDTTTNNGIFLTNYVDNRDYWFKEPEGSDQISIFIPGGTENLDTYSAGYFCYKISSNEEWDSSESTLDIATHSCKFGIVYYARGADGWVYNKAGQDIDEVRTHVSNRYSFGCSSEGSVFTIPLRPEKPEDGENTDPINNNLSLSYGGGASPSYNYGVGGQYDTYNEKIDPPGVGALGIYWVE